MGSVMSSIYLARRQSQAASRGGRGLTGSTSRIALVAAMTATGGNVNVLNLLSPYLNLNATPVGQQTLQLNLSRAISENNNATPAIQAPAISELAPKANTVAGRLTLK